MAFNISLNSDFSQNEKLHRFWKDMRDKLPYLRKWDIDINTEVHPKEFSDGQKQLLSALRACYLRRPVVLLDEIASALDSELEESLRRVILDIQRNSITMIVAHRLETVVMADAILVMDDGVLKAQGTHQELSQQTH